MAEAMKGLHRSHRCTEVGCDQIGSEVTVMGWVQKRRNLGSLIFIDLRDRSGILQLIFDESQKECDNEIWIDFYQLARFLHAHRSKVVRDDATKEWKRQYGMRDPAVESYEKSIKDGTQDSSE